MMPNSITSIPSPKSFLSLGLKLCGIGLSIAAVFYVAACLYLYFRQTHLIFLPSREIDITPARFDRPYQEVWLSVDQDAQSVKQSAKSTEPSLSPPTANHQPASPSTASEQIHGWWLPSSNPNPNVLLYLHGNSSSLSANAEHASRLNRLGFSVLIIDYRGYGKSDGNSPNEQQVYADAQVAWNYLTQDRHIPAQRIFIYGHSLGGAIAIHLASNNPTAAGLIVESSFTSMASAARQTSFYNIFPIELILTQKFDSIDRVPLLKMPALFIHGGADHDISPEMGKALYNAAPHPKFLYIEPQAGHDNTAAIGGEKYLQVVREFVQKVKQAN